MAEFSPCQVSARFLPDGRPVPQTLTWHGQSHHVVAVGRTWTANDAWHVLIQLPDGTTLELRYTPPTWAARPINKPFHYV